jgi:hypothetical protein
MSNFLMGIVGGFFLCVWALNANPVTATASLVERFQQIQVSFAAEPEPDPTLEPLPAFLPPERPTANPYY